MKRAYPLRCTKFGCDKALLVRLVPGESLQTGNGFFVIKKRGWYCPKCGGGYG